MYRASIMPGFLLDIRIFSKCFSSGRDEEYRGELDKVRGEMSES